MEHTTGAEFVDQLDIELLRPEDATSPGIGLGHDHLSVAIGHMDIRHTFLLHPDITELTHLYRRCLLGKGLDELIP